MKPRWRKLGPYSNMTGTPIREEETDTHGGGGRYVKMESEIAAVLPQAKECLRLPVTRAPSLTKL